ncbi:MAG: hypothetical protein HYV63_13335 [Candidatus Schekmanbacteria bacterium]|nr:hypothetical protein [Candidatus Schekmanbacteria bacterium]
MSGPERERAAVLAYLSWSRALLARHPSAGRAALDPILTALKGGDPAPVLAEAAKAERILAELREPPAAVGVPAACESLHDGQQRLFSAVAEMLREQAGYARGKDGAMRHVVRTLRSMQRIVRLARRTEAEAKALESAHRAGPAPADR